MELNQSLAQLKKSGLGLAAISYDSPAILKHFAERQNIRFPLLSDADSKIIRAFGIFNEAIPMANPFHGVPHPVTFITGRGGKIRTKYFEEDFRQRQTLAGVLARDYNVTPDAATGTVPAKHVAIRTAASTSTVRSGQRIILTVDVDIPKKFHLYAPGATGYIAVEWNVAATGQYQVLDVVFPAARTLHLPAINETAPVYEGKLRLMRDVVIGGDKLLQPLLAAKGNLIVEGTFRYQACDDRVCYTPETVPVKWTFAVEAHDRQRVPKELQRLGKTGL